MTLRITCLNKMYYDYVLLKVIYICNLLHHNTVHTAYVITYTVRGITFDVLSESAWVHPLENLEST